MQATVKGEEKNLHKATNPHSGEVFGELKSSSHFPPLCQVGKKQKKNQNNIHLHLLVDLCCPGEPRKAADALFHMISILLMLIKQLW